MFESTNSNTFDTVTFDGRPLGMEAAQKLIKVFDKDRNGRIDFNEYATMHQFITRVRQAFIIADTDRSGRIEAREIYQALAGAGLNFVSFQTILELLHKYDRTRLGLSWEEFLMLAAHCAHCKSIFEWYSFSLVFLDDFDQRELFFIEYLVYRNDRDRDGWITINLDQLIQLTSYLS
jgi:Ca2+-binding EF-hand superfamily protein